METGSCCCGGRGGSGGGGRWGYGVGAMTWIDPSPGDHSLRCWQSLGGCRRKTDEDDGNVYN